MFSDTYFPYISGVVRSIERLSEGLRQRGHRVTVFGPRYMGYTDDKTTAEDIRRCRALPIYPAGNIVFPLPSLSSLYREAKESEVDIIHSHSPFTMGLAAIQVGRRLDVPVVFTHHSVYHEYAIYAPKPLRRPTERVILDWVNHYVHQVDLVVAPSVNTQEFVRVAYDIESVVVSNPILIGSNRVCDAPPVSAEPIILYVGRLGKEKHLPLLIQAYSLVRQKVPARLVLVGDGPERSTVEELAEDLGVRQGITITGFLSYSEVSYWYRQATVFAFPSDKETQGMVVLEALAHGVPVIAVESEASQAIFETCRAGHVTESDPAAMAEAILDVLAAPDGLKRMSEEGRVYARRFSPASVAAEMERVYASIGGREQEG